MRKLIVFNNTTVDGYFTDKNNDMSWAHTSDPEWDAFIADNAKVTAVQPRYWGQGPAASLHELHAP